MLCVCARCVVWAFTSKMFLRAISDTTIGLDRRGMPKRRGCGDRGTKESRNEEIAKRRNREAEKPHPTDDGGATPVRHNRFTVLAERKMAVGGTARSRPRRNYRAGRPFRGALRPFRTSRVRVASVRTLVSGRNGRPRPRPGRDRRLFGQNDPSDGSVARTDPSPKRFGNPKAKTTTRTKTEDEKRAGWKPMRLRPRRPLRLSLRFPERERTEEKEGRRERGEREKHGGTKPDGSSPAAAPGKIIANEQQHPKRFARHKTRPTRFRQTNTRCQQEQWFSWASEDPSVAISWPRGT